MGDGNMVSHANRLSMDRAIAVISLLKSIRMLSGVWDSGNGVVSAAAERMAAADALGGKIPAFCRAVFLHGFYGILRAGWYIAAARRDERADADLVETDEEKEQSAHGSF